MQSEAEGQCLSAGQDFNTEQEAFTLAQAAEQQRRMQPFGGNYGLGSYTLCYKDGSQRRVQSPVFRGYRNTTDKTKPPNYTHSEQATYGWLQSEFSHLSIDRGRVRAIYTVIFSQVVICLPCRRDMKSWQRTLRQIVKTNNLFLSVWDIAPEKSFAPSTYPAGIGTPIAADDLEEVRIQFDP